VWLAVAAATALSALLGTIAADLRWLAALGAHIVQHGTIPDFVPFASAASDGWPNVPVLGELVIHALDSVAADRGLLLAQVAAVAVAFTLVALDMRGARAAESGSLLALLLLIPSTVTSLALIRAQLFSLALFPLLVLLLRREARDPSRLVWLVPPLIALWCNLHGGVLVGVAVAFSYLLLERGRREPRVALGVAGASLVALFATPALWRTGTYFAGVLDNEAAQRGVGLWRPVSLHSGFDLAFIVCGLVLAIAALRSRPRLWEVAALAGLAVLTGLAARGEVWFALFAATPAACGIGGGRVRRPQLLRPALVVLIGLSVWGLVRGPADPAAGDRVLRRALAEAGDTPVLATDLLAEQVALAGGQIWLGNPIDAFERRDQQLYLDWAEGRPSGDAALDKVPRAVLVSPRSGAGRRLADNPAFSPIAADDDAVLYVRRPTSDAP